MTNGLIKQCTERIKLDIKHATWSNTSINLGALGRHALRDESITPQCQAEDASLILTTKGNHSTMSGGACFFEIDHEEHSLHNVRRSDVSS